jgi:hypothetical protein
MHAMISRNCENTDHKTSLRTMMVVAAAAMMTRVQRSIYLAEVNIIILPHGRWTIDGVWISNRIYWPLKQLVTALYKSPSHTDWCSLSRSSLHCLVKSSSSGQSSAPGLTSSQACRHLTPTSYASNCHLRTFLSTQW